jgi:hypothetical protein
MVDKPPSFMRFEYAGSQATFEYTTFIRGQVGMVERFKFYAPSS